MKNNLLAIIAIVMLCFGSSCSSYQHIPYFQDLNKDKITTEEITNYHPLTIQPGDLLGIHFNSLNPKASDIFNYNLVRENGDSMGNGASPDRPAESAVIGYLVDQKGNISLPLVGNMYVAGLTTTEIATKIKAKVKDLLSEPAITVRLMNFKVSVLGDVQHPGTFPVTDEKLTVTQALALAGDLNITGIRNNIFLIREISGKREYIPINLNSKETFTSPYYYLKNNDVIVVQPNREKAAVSGTGLQKASIIVSALSILAILATQIKF